MRQWPNCGDASTTSMADPAVETSRHSTVTGLARYLETIVEPTFEDFKRNPLSQRHAFLACVAAYHAIDRATYPAKPSNLRKEWREKSLQFKIVDMIAHHFKHVRSDDEKHPPRYPGIPLSRIVFGAGTLNSYCLNTRAFNQGGMDLHNLHFIIQDAIKFLHQQAAQPEPKSRSRQRLDPKTEVDAEVR